MRLLAYGGNASRERRRIGEWPIPEPTLQSNYGIEVLGALSFGCAILDQQPYLIFRERQGEERGGYPFTLLLDPGREIWQEWKWNGAALIQALLNSDGREALFLQPERLDEPALARILVGLPVPAQRSVAPAADDWLGLWVGSNLAEEPLTVAADVLGFSTRPDPASICKLAAVLPPCFQIGSGWLIAGTPAQGRTYGAKLLIDEQPETTSGELNRIRSAGMEVWRTWREFMSNPSVAEPIMRLAGTPAGCWDEDVRSVLDDLETLAAIEKTGAPTDELLAHVRRRKPSRALGTLVRKSAVGKLERSRSVLMPGQTIYLMVQCIQGDYTITENLASRLDPGALLSELEGRSIPPGPWPTRLHLPLKMRAEIWRKKIDGVPRYVADLLDAALQDLAGANENERLHLVRVALARLPQYADGLAGWKTLRNRPEIGPIIAAPLRAEAERRAIERVGAWEKDYLAFAEDPGGERCFGSNDEPAFTAIARTIGELLDSIGPADDELRLAAREWIDALARGKHRKSLPLRLKRSLARKFGGAWRPLAVLDELLHGESSGVFPELDAVESQALGEELVEFLEEKVPSKATSQLAALLNWLQPIPPAALNKLLALNPELQSSEDADGWIECLRRMVGEEEANRRRMLLLRASPRTFMNAMAVNAGDLPELVFEALFGAATDRELLSTLVGRSSEEFGRAVDAAIGRATDEEARRLATRYARDKEMLGAVFEHAGSGSLERLARWLADFAAAEFLEEATDIIPRAMDVRGYQSKWFLAVAHTLVERPALLAEAANALDQPLSKFEERLKNTLSNAARSEP